MEYSSFNIVMPMDYKISQYISSTHILYNLKAIFIGGLGSKRRKIILINYFLPVALASKLPIVIFKLTKLK